MNKYFIVDYDYQTGEHGVPKQKLLVGEENKTIDEILDSYFSDFFGEGTQKVVYSYWSIDEEQVIRVTSWKQVPVEDALILKKYLH